MTWATSEHALHFLFQFYIIIYRDVSFVICSVRGDAENMENIVAFMDF